MSILSLSRLALRAAAAAVLGVGLLLVLPTPAEAQGVTYCQQSDTSLCVGPSTMPHEDISGSQQRQIMQRLQQLRCEGR